MNVLIVSHAGAGLGLGHLARSLVVAHALHQELGAHAHFLIQGDPLQRADLGKFDHHFLRLDEDLLHAVRQQVKRTGTRVVVLDLHPRLVPADIGGLLGDLRQAGCKVISVDGLLDYRSKLDLIFIPSFRFLPPNGLVGGAPILYGWDCFLLNVSRVPVEWKPGSRVLALAGGSDATGLGKTLPVLLNETLPAGTELHWVTGPYAQAPVWPVTPRLSMKNHLSPSRLDDLMIETNYAVTVYGVSFFELLYYGIPAVVFSPYGNKDDADLAAIAEAGVALVAKDEVEAVGKLKDLMDDDTLAAAMSQRAKRRMSNLGGQNFARAVAGLLN